LIPTAAHSLADVERTIKAFKEIKQNLELGKYNQDEVVNAFL
jgi:glycine C-acetyltransferase